MTDLSDKFDTLPHHLEPVGTPGKYRLEVREHESTARLVPENSTAYLNDSYAIADFYGPDRLENAARYRDWHNDQVPS